MIKEIKLIMFQKHKEITLKLTEGFNVIRGESGEGKSSIIRALLLLLMNQPTKRGDTKYQNKYTETPLEVHVKDDKGNIVKRTKRKYYLNETLLKAFNNDVPDPIKEIFPFKDLNWKKQLDQHFLILQSGGSAAKLLNSATGMEDQEWLIKTIKDDLSEYKAEIKRLIKNNQVYQETVNQLKSVTRLNIKAQYIKNLQNDSDKIETKINKLRQLVKQITDCQFDHSIFKTISDLYNKISDVEKIQVDRNNITNKINSLKSIVKQLEEIQYFSEKNKKITILLDRINEVAVRIQAQQQLQQHLSFISSTINQIQQAKKTYIHCDSEYEITLNKFNETLILIGECPLCGSTFGKEHTCNTV